MAASIDKPNITWGQMGIILTIISMVVAVVWSAASLKSSIDVLAETMSGVKLEVREFKSEVKTQFITIDDRQRLNDTRLTKLETLAGARSGATP